MVEIAAPHLQRTAQSTHFVRKVEAASSAVTSAELCVAYLERSFAFSHSKNLIPFFVTGARPKWQYAALSWYFGSRSASETASAPGRASKLIFTMFVISCAVRDPCSVPYVSTKSESGLATPIAYDSCTNARLQRPLFTTDLAICRHA